MPIPLHKLQSARGKIGPVINLPNQPQGYGENESSYNKENVIIGKIDGVTKEENQFRLNEKLIVEQSQMVSMEISEDISVPFETFHGVFILNWSEFSKTANLQIITPHTIEIKIRFPRHVGENPEYDEREYKIIIYNFIRNNYAHGKYYPELGEYANTTSLSEYEWWGVPDYQYKLIETPMKQYSFKDKTYHEILGYIQKELLKVKFEPEDDKFVEKQLNKIPANDPYIFPSTIPTLQVIENIVMNTWYPTKIKQHAIPIYFINNGKFYYKIQNKENCCDLDVYIGDKILELNVMLDITKQRKKQNKLKYVFQDCIIDSTARSSRFGQVTRRNSVDVHEQKSTGDQQQSEKQIPLKHKQTMWLNSQNPEPFYGDGNEDGFHKTYKDYWEYDQYYLEDEYFLENRMQKKYNLDLLYSFYGQETISVQQNALEINNILEDLYLSRVVKIYIDDSQIINREVKDDNQPIDPIGQIILRRSLLIVPQSHYFGIHIVFGTQGKWQNYKEDKKQDLWNYLCEHKKDKDNKTYQQD